jgi:aminoglycoside phosphotransferase family enzyme/predicted kinase
VADQPQLIRALVDPARYPHPVAQVEVVETHISWVVLTGRFAYKIKKPVRLDFVDFSTLELRRKACHDELRLNRRFAPQIYLDVVAITGSAAQPAIGGCGAPVDYAVKMAQFPARARLDRVLAEGKFRPTDCDRLARRIADSHLRAGVAAVETPFGEPVTVARHVGDVLKSAQEQTRGGLQEALVARISAWVDGELVRLVPIFKQRKSAGRIRECHGDLHSENIVMLDSEAVPFDCLEFRDDLRWIDCASDIAFLGMDLADRGHPAFAHRLINAYVEKTGDIESLYVLRYYQVYRALVRAVVTTLQDQAARAGRISDRASSYLQLAEQYTQPRQAALIVTHGVSGTGKTTATQDLLERLGAVRLRSDVERLRREKANAAALDSMAGRYALAARQAVYDVLLRRANIGLTAGYPIIVDATFLHRQHRDAFRQLAARRNVPFVILAFDADPDTLRQRIAERQRAGGDASEATPTVLEGQLTEREALADDEREYVVAIHDGDVRPAIERLQSQ